MPVKYTEKGYGLHERIQAAGQWIEHIDDTTISSDDVVVQLIIDTYTAADAAEYRIRTELDPRANKLREQVVAGVSPAEMASWSLKLKEAQQYDGTDASAPMLTAEAKDRQVGTGDLVAMVLTNAAALSGAEAHIAGIRGKHSDALKALGSSGDMDGVLAYDLSEGWKL